MSKFAGGDGEGRRSGNPIRWVLGFGYFVQGFRGFPWLGSNFFLTGGLKVNPSVLQVFQNSANLPMVGKPIYGVISDAVYIFGQHRIPYIAIGALLQAISWLPVASLSRSNASIIHLSLYLLLSNLGASLAEAANDAIVAETGKQKTSSSSSSKTSQQSSSSGELQSFVWMASSLGGILGNLLGGLVIERFSPQSTFLLFGILTFLQFLVTINIREGSLKLPKSPSPAGIRKQFSDLSHALRKPEISYSIAWVLLSTAVVPVLTGTMFFYQTKFLKIDASMLGISKVFGQMAMFLRGVIHNRWLKSTPPRKLITAIQGTTAVFVISDLLFVKGVYRQMGIPDSFYVLFFSGILENLFTFKNLPLNVLMARLCPPGCEGSLMAFVMSAIALAFIVSGYLGIVLASFVGATGDDFSGFSRGLVIEAICVALPLLLSSWIYDDTETKRRSKSKNEEERCKSPL
ncbi:PREDICTED: probable folate-biopterin transporter 7 [Tarenaya hassleriana]|uniref:probable folate-biopterin transporter 7 n=1 Tax=Tarenaya hassleriana TaxID=28532 RepID=UPI00053C18F9|nr:PREDICTED: probable folate-biopterin transporter 7 [Tarenaya hassleriana]